MAKDLTSIKGGKRRRADKFDGNSLKKEAYLEALERGLSRTRAAAQAGVSYQTVYNYRKKNPDFELEEHNAKQRAIGVIENAGFELAQRNVTANIFWLKNQAPERWTDVYDEVLRKRLVTEAKEQLADALTKAFSEEGIDSDVIERIAERVRNAG